MPLHGRLPLLAAASALMIVFTATRASSDAAVDNLIAQTEAPAGVVFEIVSAQRDALATTLPKVRKYIDVLRQRFPGLDVAVVSHGFEQFSLLDKHRDTQNTIHALARDLLAQTEVQVEVCGNHAGMYGIGAEAFPEYVEVVPAAPARIRDYQSLGYELIVVR